MYKIVKKNTVKEIEGNYFHGESARLLPCPGKFSVSQEKKENRC